MKTFLFKEIVCGKWNVGLVVKYSIQIKSLPILPDISLKRNDYKTVSLRIGINIQPNPLSFSANTPFKRLLWQQVSSERFIMLSSDLVNNAEFFNWASLVEWFYWFVLNPNSDYILKITTLTDVYKSKSTISLAYKFKLLNCELFMVTFYNMVSIRYVILISDESCVSQIMIVPMIMSVENHQHCLEKKWKYAFAKGKSLEILHFPMCHK